MFYYLKNNKIILVIVIILIIIVIKNAFTNNMEKFNSEKLDDSNFITEDNELKSTTGKLFVDIKGGINFPGVYEMNEGDRVVDVIEKAGGMTHDNS